ncbi:transmembrane protein 180-like [Lineus longissimus]|uniref:transmembrane protein 180-like n=1 Tax=Lineus longissimus TaxID=88925 RepID=UPI002B4E312D
MRKIYCPFISSAFKSTMVSFPKLHRNSVAYALISLASGMMGSIFGFYYVNIFLNRYKIEESWFQASQVLYMIWNAINDPLFGYWQDNFQGECFKTRSSAIKYGALLWAISFLIPWFPWTSDPANTVIIGIHLTVSLFMWDALLTSVLLAQCAVFTEMSKKTEDRMRLVRYTQVASFVGHFSVFVTEYFSSNLKNYRTFQGMTIIIAIIAWLLLRYAGDNVLTEYDQTLPDVNGDKEVVKPGTGGTGWRAYFKLTWQIMKNGNFVCFVLTNFLTIFCSTYNGNFSRIICNYLIPETDLSSFWRSALYGSFMVVPSLTVFLGSTVVAKVGYYRIIKCNFILQILVAATMYFLGREHTWLLAAFFLIEITISASSFALYNLPLSDIIEEDRIMYGRSHPVSAMVYGTNALITKSANSFPPMVAVMVFNKHGYNQLRDGKLKVGPEQNDLFDTMFFLTCLIPVIMGFLQLIVWSFYRIRNSHTVDAKHLEAATY